MHCTGREKQSSVCHLIAIFQRPAHKPIALAYNHISFRNSIILKITVENQRFYVLYSGNSIVAFNVILSTL